MTNDTVTGRCARLTVATGVLWLLLAGPAYLLAGLDGLTGMSIAAGLCFLPGLLILSLAGLSSGTGSPAMVVLGGTMLRLLFVLVGTLTVQSVLPHLKFREFIIWLLVFYLATLLVETLLVLKQAPSLVEDVPARSESADTATR